MSIDRLSEETTSQTTYAFNIWVYDIETYPNCFLAIFKALDPANQEKYLRFRDSDLDSLKLFLASEDLVLIGYNNFAFDDVVLKAIIDGKVSTAEEIHGFATRIIKSSSSDDKEIRGLTYHNRKEWGDRTSPWWCIDLFQILGGKVRAGSLKSHEVRLGLRDVRDLPYKPDTVLTPEQIQELTHYCENDVIATEAVYDDIRPLIEVRFAVNQQFPYLSSSALRRTDPGIAERVLKRELETKAGINLRNVRKPSKFIFNPSSHIDSAIEFQVEQNQNQLERLKSMASFDAVNWSEKEYTGLQFRAGSHRIILGKGGIHTAIPHLHIKSKNIVGYDVTSYYPSLLRRFNRYPEGLTSRWIDIFNSLTDERLEAKRSGDDAKASVYKIIINSIYGKLEDKTSINLDTSLRLAVVLNGQLFLIMLMEAFHEAGFDVISANTDGIYIDAENRLLEAQEIADKWMHTTGFTLDREIATQLVATNVNNYALYDPSKGWYKKKGQFNNSTRKQPAVISEAVLNHFSSGKSVGTLIRETNNILDFLYSSSIHGAVEQVLHGKKQVQKTNRWYRSIDGKPIHKVISSKEGNLKWIQIPNSESCTVVNTLNTFDIPSDLDFDHYIQMAEQLLEDIKEHKPPKEKIQSTLIKAATKVQEKGFVVVPKGRSGNEKANVKDTYTDETIRYWQETPLEDADWLDYKGFGAYTGQAFGLLAIDIDYPKKAKESGLFEHVRKSHSVAWHGNVSHEAILAGESGGTLLFRYNGEDLHSTNANYLQAHGFELLYGRKVVQLAGRHPDGDDYQVRGKPKSLPKKLLDFLIWTLPESQKSEGSEPIGENQSESDELLSNFQAVANSDSEYKDIEGKLQLVEGNWGPQLEGLCIGYQEHSNRQGDQNMRVFLRNGTPFVHCYHQSCWSIRTQWQKRIYDQISPNKDVVVKPENIVLKGEAKEIGIALDNPDRFKLIIAPTGSGKTHAIVTHISKQLAEKQKGVKFAIICSSKDQMRQLGERFSDILESNNINKYGIDLIESTASVDVKEAKSRDSVRTGTRVAITHYTYVSRRKFSQQYYAFLKFIDQNTHVFIDEADAFVESQTTHYPLGSRKRRISKGGKIKNIHVAKCGMFHGYSNCTNCIMHKYDGNRLDVDDYRNLGYIPVMEYMEGTQLGALEHIEIESRLASKVRVGTSEIMMLKQKQDSGQIQFDQDEYAADFKTIFDDHLDSAYLPTVHRPVVLYDDEEITRDALIEKYQLNQDKGLSDIPEDERRRLRFPSRACNVLTVTTIDRRPIEWMSKAKSVTSLTATLSPTQQRFLVNQLENLKRFDIAPLNDRKMDKIIVIGMSRKIPLKMYQKGHLTFDRMFRYRETQRAALRDFNVLCNGNLKINLGYNRRNYSFDEDEQEKGTSEILLTYAFSSLGRGVDFASYDLVDINAGIYKPISAYVTDNPKVLKEQLEEERINIVIQNVGRILRRTEDGDGAVKVIIIEQLEVDSELETLVKVFSEMSHEPVDSWWVPEFLSNEEVSEHISQTAREKALPSDLPINYQVLVDRAEKLIAKGTGKTKIKKELRWQTVRKKLTTEEAREVEESIDQLIAVRNSDKEASVSEKSQKLRDKRLRKMLELKDQGHTVAQIRARMKVQSGKYPWPISEQQWFDSQMNSS